MAVRIRPFKAEEQGQPPAFVVESDAKAVLELNPDTGAVDQMWNFVKEELTTVRAAQNVNIWILLIPQGFVRFSIRMSWKWVGVDGKGYANTI